VQELFSELDPEVLPAELGLPLQNDKITNVTTDEVLSQAMSNVIQ
jgi:hypothetical protein